MSQHHADSIMEAVVNTLIGFFITMVVNTLIGFFITMVVYQFCWAMLHMNVSMAKTGALTAIFTVVSIVRQYVLRRLFNGRSVWCAIKARFFFQNKCASDN